jgi:V/A-type H+-transporting ATPase subunit E
VSRETAEAVSKILGTSVKQAEVLKRQVIGSAELESRNLQLRALEEAVNEVFAEAVKHLAELSPAQYEEALTKLVEEGIEIIGPKALISCNTNDKKLLTSAIRKLNKGGVKLTLDPRAIETIGGVILTSHEGTVRFDNTFEARLERMRQILRKDVANQLNRSPKEPSTAPALP